MAPAMLTDLDIFGIMAAAQRKGRHTEREREEKEVNEMKKERTWKEKR